jgi:hypothetical protein
MSADWTPPEDRIADLISRFTPRQLAIGYLRAQKRAREAELFAEVMTGLSDAAVSVATGDGKSAADGLDRSLKAMRTANEVLENGQANSQTTDRGAA